MPSLADLPELIGFFSYSRDDDEDSKGALSALRDQIQRELRGQLGRSFKTFRLWQDKEAIAPGKLWESEIRNAISQSAFFIPIITPTVVKSPYCHFELEAFLAREQALGRSDLVFPILYIRVPALEDEAAVKKDPVLSTIARRQYVDWREFRHRDVNAPEIKTRVERFCESIVKALHEHWVAPEERRRHDEDEARRRAEAERLAQEAEAQRRRDEARQREEERARPVPAATPRPAAAADPGNAVRQFAPAPIMLWAVVALLAAQVIGRVGITIYLWNTIAGGPSDIFIAFAAGWFVLAVATIAVAGRMAKREDTRTLGLVVCALGTLNDAFILGILNTQSSLSRWDMVLSVASVFYLAVGLLALGYLWRAYDSARQAT